MIHALSRCLPLVAGWLSVLSAAAQPDTLPPMPQPLRERYRAMKHGYLRTMKEGDTVAAGRLRRAWEAFLVQYGTERDRLYGQMDILEADRDNQFDLPRFLPRLQRLTRQAEALNDTLLKARLTLRRGYYHYHQTQQYDLAFRCFAEVFEVLKTKTEAEFWGRDYALYNFGLAAYDFFDYETAIRYGSAIPRVPPDRVRDFHVYNASLLGLSYLHLKRYPQARAWFAWGLRQLPIRHVKFNNDDWVGIFSGSLGRVYLAENRPDEALPLLRRGLERTALGGVWDNVAPIGSQLAELHLRRGQVALAQRYAWQAHAAARRTGQVKFTHDTYQTLADCLEAGGQAALALRYADSARQASDQYRRDIDVTLKHRAEMAVANERYRANEARLQGERDRQVLLRNGLLLFVALVAVAAWGVYTHRATTDRHRRERLEAENSRMEAELRHAQAHLDEFRRSVREKSALIERLGESGVAEAPGSVPAEVLNQLRRSVVLTDEGWQTFSARFERVHAGFFHRLKTTYPDLTPGEVRFAALARLGCSASEMAAILGVGTGAIRQYRLRMRRKLALPEAANLEAMMKAV